MTPISTATSSDARLPNPRISFTARYFSGYRLLLRLAVRRERIIAPVTVIIFVILDLATAASIASMYPTAEKRRELAAGPGANSAFRFLLGDTIHIDSTASAVVWRAGLFMIAAVGVCAVLMVVRGTRKEEELGRVELIRAGVVGPLAPLAAAATVAAAFSVVVGLAMSLVLIPFGGGGVAVLVVFAQYAGTGLIVNVTTLDGPDGPRLVATWVWQPGVVDEDTVTSWADRWVAELTAATAASGAPTDTVNTVNTDEGEH